MTVEEWRKSNPNCYTCKYIVGGFLTNKCSAKQTEIGITDRKNKKIAKTCQLYTPENIETK